MANSNPACRAPSCGDWCLSHGHSLPSCDLPPYATHYTFGPFGTPPSGACYPDAPMIALDSATCKWVEGDIVFDLENGILIYSLGDYPEYTLIWATGPDFDPLCPSFMVYDKDHPLNNPPPDCDVVEVLCCSPSSVCCDNIDHRPESMPNTLYGTLDYCCGTNQHLFHSFEMVWNESTGKWESESFSLCNATIEVSIWCACGTLEGCTGGAVPCYPVTFLVDNFSVTTNQDLECSCYPFQTTYDVNWYPCSVDYLQSVTLTVTE
ncbi:hypothetical protein [Thalassoglobus sp.]|uniref:hypothetical protein n=1 Tax=Thalassoglobus sp. TaxID=2795869 RepID=UPI003AA7FD24